MWAPCGGGPGADRVVWSGGVAGFGGISPFEGNGLPQRLPGQAAQRWGFGPLVFSANRHYGARSTTKLHRLILSQIEGLFQLNGKGYAPVGIC